MTSVIGIMNKSGIALAADSAVTVESPGKRKIYNTANKIFTLSKYHPVGIMIYNAASFMEIPWETIIKLYRSQLKARSFPTLAEYMNDFLKFLKEKHFFIPEESQKTALKLSFQIALLQIKHDIEKSPDFLTASGIEERQQKTLDLLLNQIEKNIVVFNADPDILPDFHDYSIASFRKFAENEIVVMFNEIFKPIALPNHLINKMIELFYLYYCRKAFLGPWSGLVFAGFGDEEIFPGTISIQISDVIDNHMRYFVDQKQHISLEQHGVIMPFAQRDVIDTIIAGIDPSLDITIQRVFEKLFNQYNATIIQTLLSQQPEIADRIKNLNITTVIQEFANQIQIVKNTKYIQPIVNTVAALSKEDLAEMAESLIYLTFLKRRISSADESVGGPVDVAIISKGDGFIWIKRKHYFEPNLNQQFFNNYFKI